MAPKTRPSKEEKGKGAQSSAPPQPNLDIFKGSTREEKKAWEKIKNKRTLANKIPHNLNLMTLGVKEEVENHLSRLNWNSFIFPIEDGYEELTKEFLSTLVLEKKASSDFGHYGIKFKLFGKAYGLRLEEFASIFNFQTEGATMFTSMESSFTDFWREISIETRYDTKSSLSKSFKSLTYWILHRIITFSINARSDGNEKVSQKDLFFLYGMIKNMPIQSSKFLIDHFVHLSKDERGSILLPSHVTMIAKHVGALTNQNKALLKQCTILPSGSNWIDIDYMERAGAILREGDGYVYALGEKGFQLEESKRSKKRQRLDVQEEASHSSSRHQGTQTSPLPTSSHTSPHKIERMFSKIMKRLSLVNHLHQDIVEIQGKMGLDACHLQDWDTSEEEEEEDED